MTHFPIHLGTLRRALTVAGLLAFLGAFGGFGVQGVRGVRGVRGGHGGIDGADSVAFWTKILAPRALIPAPQALHAQAPSAAPDSTSADSVYEYGTRTRDGTGKYYMGREISMVMGHQGAGWLERPGREQEERTDLFMERVPVEPDDVVADIGAGTGYFAFPIAERVPEGRVLAVDIQPEMLAIIEERKRERGVDNVETIRGTVTDPNLPEGEVDLIYIVDAYHEFSHPREMGEAMFDALRPGGQLILLEYRAEDPTVPIKPLHKMTEEQARREMDVLGFEWVETEEYLPQQHVLVFEKP